MHDRIFCSTLLKDSYANYSFTSFKNYKNCYSN